MSRNERSIRCSYICIKFDLEEYLGEQKTRFDGSLWVRCSHFTLRPLKYFFELLLCQKFKWHIFYVFKWYVCVFQCLNQWHSRFKVQGSTRTGAKIAFEGSNFRESQMRYLFFLFFFSFTDGYLSENPFEGLPTTPFYYSIFIKECFIFMTLWIYINGRKTGFNYFLPFWPPSSDKK